MKLRQYKKQKAELVMRFVKLFKLKKILKKKIKTILLLKLYLVIKLTLIYNKYVNKNYKSRLTLKD